MAKFFQIEPVSEEEILTINSYSLNSRAGCIPHYVVKENGAGNISLVGKNIFKHVEKSPALPLKINIKPKNDYFFVNWNPKTIGGVVNELKTMPLHNGYSITQLHLNNGAIIGFQPPRKRKRKTGIDLINKYIQLENDELLICCGGKKRKWKT